MEQPQRQQRRPRIRVRSGLLAATRKQQQQGAGSLDTYAAATIVVISDEDKSEAEDPLVAFHSSLHEIMHSRQEEEEKEEAVLLVRSSPNDAEIIDISDDDKPGDCFVIDCDDNNEDVKEDKKEIEEEVAIREAQSVPPVVPIEAHRDPPVLIEVPSDPPVVISVPAASPHNIICGQLHTCPVCWRQFCTAAGLCRHRRKQHKRWALMHHHICGS
jgi:hypothetical protein